MIAVVEVEAAVEVHAVEVDAVEVNAVEVDTVDAVGVDVKVVELVKLKVTHWLKFDNTFSS